jgi:hypothetical protein
MSAQVTDNSSVTKTLSLGEAAARFAISPQTLRRLCDTGRLSCERDARGWRVQPKEVENYLLARRPPGRQSVALWLQGPAPNPRLRDGVGWLFKAAAIGGKHRWIQIWFSNELVAILQLDDYDVRDLVVRGAERLVANAMLERDDFEGNQEILYGSADRSFVLRAAGIGEESYLPSEAPLEEGVSVLYEFTPRDFANNALWPGDSIGTSDSTLVDVVVDTRTDGNSRRVRTVRIVASERASRAQAIEGALRAYERRCQRVGERLGSWVTQASVRSNALTLAQQRVLDIVYQCWRKENEWPLFSYVQQRVDNEYDLVLTEVLGTFPPGLLYGLSHYRMQVDRLTLTVGGLLHCENSGADVELFMATLGYFMQRQRTFMPSTAVKEENLAVTSDEVRRDVPLAAAAPPGAVERLYDFFMQDPYASHGGGRYPTGAWSINLGPEIRRYRGIQTIDDYLARRQPEATATDSAPTSPPRHVGAIRAAEQALENVSTKPRKRDGGRVHAVDEAEIFVLMPFASEFGEVWEAIQDTSSELDVTCERADSITRPGRITQQIVESIRAASVIIADVTNNNPNVMFELGYADAIGKPIVLLNQRLEDAPFDLRDWRQIPYRADSLEEMRNNLARFLDDALIKPRKLQRTGDVRSSVSDKDSEDDPKARAEAEIASLVESRLGNTSLPLRGTDKWCLRSSLYRAGVDRGAVFDYAREPTSEGPILRFSSEYRAEGIEADHREETFKRIEENHRQLVQEVRSWPIWSRILNLPT